MIVQTANSRYVLDREAMTVTRLPKRGALRRDGEALLLLDWPHIEVGRPMAMLLALREDGVRTLRHTSPVTLVSA